MPLSISSLIQTFRKIDEWEPNKVYIPLVWLYTFENLGNLHEYHCNPVQGQYRARTGFSLCSFSTQGKTCFHYRVPRWWKQDFPCEKNYTCFHYRDGFAVWLFWLKKRQFCMKFSKNLIVLAIFTNSNLRLNVLMEAKPYVPKHDLWCAIASCDVRVRTHACGAFLVLWSAIPTSHVF